MSSLDWHELYREGDTPWEEGKPWAPLEGIVRDLLPNGGRVLDVGCGVGTQALYLAAAGFNVRGIDIVETAVETARTEAARRVLDVEFSVGDFLCDDPGGPYELVLDRSVLANAKDESERSRFAERVASVLAPGGWWVDITGSADNRDPDGGPDPRGYPRLTFAELVGACEPRFEVHSVSRTRFGETDKTDFIAWVLVLRLR